MNAAHLATAAILDALLLLMDRDVEAARDYARRRMTDLEAAETPSVTPPTTTAPDDVEDAGPHERPRSSSAERMRRKRAAAKQSNGVHARAQTTEQTTVQSPSHVTSHVTLPASQTVTCDVTCDAPGVTSRAHVVSSSLSLSRFSKAKGGGDARAGGPVTSDVTSDAVTPPVTLNAGTGPEERRDPPPSRGLKAIGGGEFAPPSGTPDAEILPWAIDRGLDPGHALFQKFLDVRRQYPRRIPDWPSAWRIFLGDEQSGKFGPRPGVRNAPAPLPHDPETAVRERQRVKARDEDYERAKANKAPMPAALLAAVGGKPRP